MKMLYSKLKQLWRILATALGFILFGLGGLLILSTLWFNLLRIFVRNKNRRNIIAQYSISVSFSFFLWILRSLRAIDYRFTGLDKLKQDRSCLIIANHPSLLDVVLLASVMPRCDCIVKESLLKNVFVRDIIKAAGYVVNSEASKMLPYCNETLASGGRILIFPEGTRSVPNEALSLQRGAANIALRCQVDIRIIHIECYPPILRKNQKWYDMPVTKPTFNITIGEKLAIKNFSDNNITISARKLTQYLTLKLSEHENNNIV
ncbi:lysophospholipid acyltransferase family protein [Orbus mooreae]|uniref:lysophospholipid acyltransferase family protein n=1 Tax=Orbus mooreae TaxID=3074107 RepID=UPI00370D32CD